MQHKDSTAAAEILDVRTGNGVSDLLRRAIERHDAAEQYFNSVCYLDEDSILGREPTATELALKNAASDAADAAMMDVCYFPARTPEDLAAKARYLRKYHSHRMGHLEDWQVENLLRSMLPAEERDAIDDGSEDANGELASMIAAHREASEYVTAYEGGIDGEEIGEHCDKQIELALKICGYRPKTEGEQISKAEFLRDWTLETQLTSEEQKALIASMLPEGGEA